MMEAWWDVLLFGCVFQCLGLLHSEWNYWRRNRKGSFTQMKPLTCTGLVVFKDELKNLKVWKRSWESVKQSPPIHWVFIDDGSTDGGGAWLESQGFQVIRNEGKGKKAGLQTGLSKINTQWVYLTDADVLFPPDFFMPSPKSEDSLVLVGSAVVSGMGSARLENAVVGRNMFQQGHLDLGYMGIGRNLLVQKAWLNECVRGYELDYGLDDYIVQSSPPTQIEWCESRGFQTITPAPGNVKDYMLQKIRHRKGGAASLPFFQQLWLFFWGTTLFMGEMFVWVTLTSGNKPEAARFFMLAMVFLVFSVVSKARYFQRFNITPIAFVLEPFVWGAWFFWSLAASKTEIRWKR